MILEPNDLERHPPFLTSMRILIVAFGLFLVAAAFMGGVAAYTFLDKPAMGDVLGDYQSPRTVPLTRPGVDGPAVTEVGMILVSGFRCVNGRDNQDVITVEMYATYRSLDNPRQTVFDSSYGKKVSRVVGCFSEDIILVLPENVKPGQWYLDVVEVAPISGEFRRWTSEPFTVIAR